MRQTGTFVALVIVSCRIEVFLVVISFTSLLLGNERYRSRGEIALLKMKSFLIHSDWNVKNKLLLLEAEYHNTMKEFEKAALCYEASIKAAQVHRFIHEEAMAHELAGIFFLERGQCHRQMSYSYFKNSISCYQKWGAMAVAKRIDTFIQTEFSPDLMHTWLADDLLALASTSSVSSEVSKKRPY
jgi:hypothetical protein